MSNTYKIELRDGADAKELHFSGNLIINHIEKMYAEMQELLLIDKAITIYIDDPDNIDITFIQLLLSIKKSCQEKKFAFDVVSSLKDDFKQLIIKAGLEKEIINK